MSAEEKPCAKCKHPIEAHGSEYQRVNPLLHGRCLRPDCGCLRYLAPTPGDTKEPQ